MTNPRLIQLSGSIKGLTQQVASLKSDVAALKAKIGTVPPASITTNLVAVGAITATQISVTNLSAISANLGAITAGTITGAVMQTGTTGARVIFDASGIRAYNSSSVQTLNINSADGSVTVTGGTITGSTFQTSASFPKVTMDTTGIKAYDSGANVKVNIDATTGLITATGVFTANSGSSIPVNTLNGNLPGSANRYSNSAFQDGAGTFDTTSWAITNATSASGGTTAPPVYGSLTLKLTASAGGDVYLQPSTITDTYKRVVPTLSYTFSHFVYPTTNARQSSINIKWYDSTGALLSATSGTLQNTTLNAWNRISQTGTAPSNAAYGIGIHYVGLSAATSDVFYVECLQMESGDRVSAWAPRPDEILFNSINANMIQANVITANKLNVTSLSAISANLGTVTAGTVTGATIQTSATDPRVALDLTGLWVTDNAGTKQAGMNTSGFVLLSGTAAQNSIQWTTGSLTGLPVAGMYVNSPSSSRTTGTFEVYPSTGSATELILRVDSGGGIANNSVFITVNYPSTQSRYILQGDGTSDYAQVDSTRSHILGQPSRMYRTLAWTTFVGPTTFSCDTMDVGDDPGNNLNGGVPNSFLCPRAGWYLVTAHGGAVASGANQYYLTLIYKNSNIETYGSIAFGNTSGLAMLSTAHALIRCAANDLLRPGYQCSTAGLTGETGKPTTAFSCMEVL